MSPLEREIAEIPERLTTVAPANRVAFAEALARYRAAPPPALFTIARGSSDAVALYTAYRLTPASKIPVGSFAPSLASLDRVRTQGGRLWTLAVSQSGQSPDLLKAQAAFATSDGARLALVSPLTAGADIVLDQHAGEEHSTAATKSVVCSLLAVDLLAEALLGHVVRLDARGVAVAGLVAKAMASPPDLTMLETVESAYVIGRGASLPVAIEAALKLKETAHLHAEAVSAAEVMHGPRAIAGKKLGVLGFAAPGPADQSPRRCERSRRSVRRPALFPRLTCRRRPCRRRR